MTKRVNELTKEEIAKMFPVKLSAYDSRWTDLFDKERKLIIETLQDAALRVEHFGSTSIPDLVAKDTIDILVEIPNDVSKQKSIIEKMKSILYDFMWQTDGEPPYMVFVKGYNTTGVEEQTYHIHMGPQNHKLWDRLYFRDYLKENKEIAKRYEKLKLELAETHKYDRVGYRIAKTEFVKDITERAKKHYLQIND
jgi:GrpB-like predicted nucleotidyltransferase (UPF0157 family)